MPSNQSCYAQTAADPESPQPAPEPFLTDQAVFAAHDQIRAAPCLWRPDIWTTTRTKSTFRAYPRLPRSELAQMGVGWNGAAHRQHVGTHVTLLGRLPVALGGRRRAVIGAHTYGYNRLSTGAAALGNFEQRRPTLAMKRAFGRLLGWKLGLHGVRAGDREVWMEGSRLRAINGHRDAGQTACPGIYLYRNLYDIRRIAIRRQRR